MTTFRCVLLLNALLFALSGATAQTKPDTLSERRLIYHAVGIDVLPTVVMREPRLSYEYRKNRWGARGMVGYRFPTYKKSDIDIGNIIDYDLFRARRGNYFGVGLNRYSARRLKRNHLINLLLGLQLNYHRYRLNDKCLYDGADSEGRTYRLLDRQILSRKSVRFVMGLSISSSLVKKVSVLTELYLGLGLGFDTVSERGTLVTTPYRGASSCHRILDGSTLEPINERYYQGVMPIELGLRVNYLVKKKIY